MPKPYLVFFCGLSWILTACQSINMVDVKHIETETHLNRERESILTSKQLSQASRNVLMSVQPKPQQCIQSPDVCMQALHQIETLNDEVVLATGSELFLSHALSLKQKAECQPKYYQNEKKAELISIKRQRYQQCTQQYLEALNQSIRYSYGYLFATKRQAQQRLFNNQQILVRDFYNQAVSFILNHYNDEELKQVFLQEYKIGESPYAIDNHLYPELSPEKIKQIISTYNLQFSGLNSLSRRDGFGTEVVIETNLATKHGDKLVDYGKEKIDIAHHVNIHQARYLPATVIVEPQAHTSVRDILTKKAMVLRIINPKQVEEVEISGKNFQLAGNFSAPYGLWLAHDKMGEIGLNTLFSQDKQFISPQLFMLEPYQPNKKLIIMIHGLASSPEAWVSVSNEIMGDAVLRENYQVWQVFYSTNIPILENRYQIYHLLQQSLAQLPQSPAPDVVLIGHSMGGVISRLLVSQDDFSDKAMNYVKKQCVACRDETFKLKEMVQASKAHLQMTPLPHVSRAIFLSSPLKGTDFADRWFTQALRKAIKSPLILLDRGFDRLGYLLTDNDQKIALKQLQEKLFQNGAGDLSPKSFFMSLTADAKIKPALKYHVIVGNQTKSNDVQVMSDGIVPYQSSHLAGAVSEKIIQGGHSIQETPEAVLELRRILHLHLNESP